MFKDPNILALFAYLAGHAVQYLTTRTLHIPAAVVAKTPALASVNDLADTVGAIAQAAVGAEIQKQMPTTPAPAPAPIVKIAPKLDIYGNPIGTQYVFNADGQPVKADVAPAETPAP